VHPMQCLCMPCMLPLDRRADSPLVLASSRYVVAVRGQPSAHAAVAALTELC